MKIFWLDKGKNITNFYNIFISIRKRKFLRLYYFTIRKRFLNEWKRKIFFQPNIYIYIYSIFARDVERMLREPPEDRLTVWIRGDEIGVAKRSAWQMRLFVWASYHEITSNSQVFSNNALVVLFPLSEKIAYFKYSLLMSLIFKCVIRFNWECN